MSIQLKRNDTKDVIGYKLTYPNNDAVNLTGASVRFVMGRGNKLITNAVAKIVNASAGEVEYTLTEADTLEAGVFHAEFEVTFSTGKVKTFPNNGYINMHIQANLDSEQSTYIEDQIAYRVSDIQILKKEIQAQIDQAVINGDSSVEAAQARVESDGTTNVTLKARLDKKEAEFSQGIETLTSELAQKAKQGNSLASFYKKLNERETVKIVCQGDSLTYGTDTVSSDRRTDAVLTTDDGTTTITPQAGKTYPEVLQEYLTEIYGSPITVLNKGIPGAWAQQSYEEVYINQNADAVLLMLGTNDSSIGGTPPTDVAGDINRYVDDMRKIIRRYLSWGTAVILLTPPKNSSPSSSGLLASYRNALYGLGVEFGCPVIDTEHLMNGCNNTYYSDGVHFNTKGYTYFASRLVSVFVGYGELNPIEIHNGTVLSFRGKRDGMVNNGGVYQQIGMSVGTEEGNSGTGSYLDLSNQDNAFFGFKTTEDAMVAIPIFKTNYNDGTERFKVKLDFANEQGSYPLLSAIGKTSPHEKPIPELSMTNYSDPQNIYSGAITLASTTKYIVITNKGWHNIKIEYVGGANTMFFGFVILSYREFKAISDINTIPKTPAVQSFTPKIGSSVTDGSHTYTNQTGKYIIDTLRKTIKLSIELAATIDSTINGDVYIKDLPKVAAATASCTLGKISGFYASSMQNISAYINNNSYVITLGKTSDDGTFSPVIGTDIRGKTISIIIDVEYMFQ